MKIFNRLLLTLLIALTATSAALAEAKRYDHNLGSFNNIRILNEIDVDIICNADSAGHVVFFAEDKAVSRIILSNNSKGKLTIETDNAIEPVKMPKITVYVAQLNHITNASDSTVLVDLRNNKVTDLQLKTSANGKIVARGINADALNLSVSTGRGKITAYGSCQDLSLSNVGTGEINTYDVKATNVKASIVGTGTIGCTVNGGTLTLRGSGTGKLYYKGTPSNVSVKKLGTLKAIPVE